MLDESYCVVGLTSLVFSSLLLFRVTSFMIFASGCRIGASPAQRRATNGGFEAEVLFYFNEVI